MNVRSLLVACVAWAVASAGAPAYAAGPAVYDRAAPLDLRTDATLTENGATIASLSFRSGDALVHADLVAPKDAGRGMPGVLFVHGLGDGEVSDRSAFLADAEWLARRGVVSLLPDEPWSQPHWFDRIRSPKSDAADSANAIVALRRCLDVLASTNGVDRNDLAYVGDDLGATYGALLAGVDARAKAFAFVSPAVSLARRFARDPAVSRADAAAFADALPASGRTVRTYAAERALRADEATDERREWLAAQLGAR